MVFNRFSAKLNAKLSIQKARPRPFLVTLVFVLLVVVLPNLVLNSVGSGLQDALYYLQAGYDPAEVFQYVFVQNSGQSAMYIVLNSLFQLFSSVVGFGYAFYAIRVARNQQAGYRDIFYGFSRIGKALWVNILIGLFTFLWTMLFILPSTIILVLAIFLQSQLLMVLYPFLMVAGTMGGILMGMRYSLSVYFMIDENCTSREAINLSKNAMRGHLGEFFTLQLTFIGWMLLSAITMGILTLWVKPYMEITCVNFYDAIRQQNDSDSDTYTGQVYHFGPGPQGPL